MKRMPLNPLSSVCLGLFFAVMPMMAASDARAARPVQLKAVTFLPTRAGTVHFMGVFADKINKRGNGELKINVLGGPEVIKGPAQTEAVRTGAIDILFVATGITRDQVPETSPMELSEYTPMEERKVGTYDWMAKYFKEKMNVHYLGKTITNVPWHTFVNFPVTRPQDLARHQIGGRSPTFEFIKAFGAVPISIGVDWFTPLDRGLIEGYTLPLPNVIPYGLHEKTKYMIDHGFYESSNGVMLVNLDKWKGLSEKHRELMTAAILEVEVESHEWFGNISESHKKKMMEAGMKMIKFSPEDAKLYRDTAYRTGWEEYKKYVSPKAYEEAKKFWVKAH